MRINMVRIAEIIKEPLIEMSFKKKKAEQIVTGLEQQINLHLLKLLGFIADENIRRHWKHELYVWMLRISSIKLKSDKGPDKAIPKEIAYAWLYEEPFGGSELSNVEGSLRLLVKSGYTRNEVSAEDIAYKLPQIHEQLAERVSRNDSGEDIINSL